MTPLWEDIWKRTENGESIRQIAKALSVSWKTVTKCRHSMGWEPPCSDSEVLRKLTALVKRLEAE